MCNCSVESKDEELLEAEGYVPGTPLEEEETVNLEELSNVPPVPPEGPGPNDYQVGTTCTPHIQPFIHIYFERPFAFLSLTLDSP